MQHGLTVQLNIRLYGYKTFCQLQTAEYDFIPASDYLNATYSWHSTFF